MSNKRKNRDKKNQKKIALNRINKLFKLADQNAQSDKIDLSNKYIEISRKISMRNLVPIPKEHKRKFCKHCYGYLLPNVTGRIRIHNGKLIIYCFNCEKYTRIPLKKQAI